MKYNSILETIGNTPLIKLNKVAQGLKPQLYAKVEFFNPLGSVKDRIGIRMLEDAERRGLLKQGATVIEATSGNTGLGLALAAVVKGYKLIVTIPDKQSREKIDLLKALGADVIVCPTAVEPADPRSFYSVAKRLSNEIPNSYYPNQYANPTNPKTHYETTGPEIWQDTDGKITHFVAGMGTGGTISGVAKFLKEKNPKVKVIGADPIGSLFYDFFHTGKVVEPHVYKVEGIGEDFFPTTLDFAVLDDVIRATDKDSFYWARRLAKEEGIFAGGSAGTAIYVAMEIAKKCKQGDLIVVLIPDTGQRALSKLYNDEWMRENQFLGTEIKLTAADIIMSKHCIKDLVSASPRDTAIAVLKKMQELDVSQMPVLENGKPTGAVYEDDIMQLIIQSKELDKIFVAEIMGKTFPILSKDASLDEVMRLITTQNPAVFIELGGGKYDIITKYDLLHSIANVKGC